MTLLRHKITKDALIYTIPKIELKNQNLILS